MHENLSFKELVELYERSEGKEGREIALELARRCREGIGIDADEESAEDWEEQARLAWPEAEAAEDEPEEAKPAAAPLDLTRFQNASIFQLNKAYKSGDLAGMYYYACYLLKNSEEKLGFSHLTELLRELDSKHDYPGRNQLLAMAKVEIGKAWLAGTGCEASRENAINCITEAAVELKNPDAMIHLISLCKEAGITDKDKEITDRLVDMERGTCKDKLAAARCYLLRGQYTYALSCGQAVARAADASEEDIRESAEIINKISAEYIKDTERVNEALQDKTDWEQYLADWDAPPKNIAGYHKKFKEMPLYLLRKKALEGSPWALEKLSLRAKGLAEHDAEVALLKEFLAVVEDPAAADPWHGELLNEDLLQYATNRLSICHRDGVGCQKDDNLAFRYCMDSVPKYHDQHSRYLLYTYYRDGTGCEPDKDKAAAALMEYGENGDTGNKAAAARELRKLGKKILSVQWYQEVLARGDMPEENFRAYYWLCEMGKEDHNNEPVTLDYLRSLKNNGNTPAAAALAWLLADDVSVDNIPEIVEIINALPEKDWSDTINRGKTQIEKLLKEKASDPNLEEKLMPVLETLEQSSAWGKMTAANAYLAMKRELYALSVWQELSLSDNAYAAEAAKQLDDYKKNTKTNVTRALMDKDDIKQYQQEMNDLPLNNETFREMPLYLLREKANSGIPGAWKALADRTIWCGDKTEFELLQKFLSSASRYSVSDSTQTPAPDKDMLGEALLRLSRIYKIGNVCTKDQARALQYCKDAALEIGYPKARYQLYEYYRDGIGCEPDKDAALKCLMDLANDPSVANVDKLSAATALVKLGKNETVQKICASVLAETKDTYSCFQAYIRLHSINGHDAAGVAVTEDYLRSCGQLGNAAADFALINILTNSDRISHEAAEEASQLLARTKKDIKKSVPLLVLNAIWCGLINGFLKKEAEEKKLAEERKAKAAAEARKKAEEERLAQERQRLLAEQEKKKAAEAKANRIRIVCFAAAIILILILAFLQSKNARKNTSKNDRQSQQTTTPYREQGEDDAQLFAGPVEIEVLHVGQGGCVVLRDGTACTLIDVGGAEDAMMIAAHLRSIGVDTIDVVLTTTDPRHCGGLTVLAEQCNVETIYTTDRIAQALSLSEYSAIQQRTLWTKGAFALQCVATAQEDGVAVMKVVAGNYSLLYLSTITIDDESELFDAYYYENIDIRANFLVAASHAEAGSNSEQLIATVGARRVFIQMDEDEVEPDLTTIVRLGRFMTRWCTDESNTAIIRIDDTTYMVTGDFSANCNGNG